MILKVKITGIYKIEHKSGYYYLGQSVSIADRWSQHITDLYLNKHSSPLFQELWDKSSITDWNFSIIKQISKTELKSKSKLRGKQFDSYLRKELLREEKEIMALFNMDKALNKQNKHFKN